MNRLRQKHMRLAAWLMGAMLVIGAGVPQTARAEGEYIKPNFTQILKMLMRFGAIDINDEGVLNNYAKVQECKLYKHFYRDVFRWNQVQAALRKSIRKDIKTYPTSISYDAELQLERYDFKKNIFNFTKKTTLTGVNLFTLDTSKEALCGVENIYFFPTVYNLILDQPINFKGLPLGKDDAKTIFYRLEKSGNKDHIIYTRFNMRVIYIAPLTRQLGLNGKPLDTLTQGRAKKTVRLDSHLDSIEFFEDKDRAKLIYSYRP